MNKELIDNLSSAVSNGRTDIVRTLLSVFENGTTPNIPKISCDELLSEACNPSGTLLHLATKLDHVDIVRTLLSSGANPNIENTIGETPVDLIQSQRMTAVYIDELLKCSAKSEVDKIHQLINAGIDVNSQDSPESRNTALHWAVSFGKLEAVQCLLDLGASPNIINGQGVTPLHEAVKRKNLEIIKSLLIAGADPMYKCSSGKYCDKTPLDLAESNQSLLELFSEFVVGDSESEHSNEAVPSEHSSKTTLDDLNSSLMSLTASEVPIKNLYTPQPMHIPPFFSTPLPLITDSKLHLLWPQPQKIVQTDGEAFKILSKCTVNIIQSSSDISALSAIDVWDVHAERFISFGCECSVENILQCNSDYSADIICHLNSQLFPRTESYKLIISKEQIRILSSDAYGLHYALCTLEQLLNLYREDGTLPSIFIHDWPQLQHRAVLLDFSQGSRKPTLETLKDYVRTMSSLKIKQMHCYFRYEQSLGHNLPMSNREFIQLSKFCTKHFVNLVPVIDVGTSEKHINVKDSITEPAHQLMSLFSSKSIHIGPNFSKIILHEILMSKNSKVIWDMLLLPTSTVVFLCYNAAQNNNELLKLLPLNCILVDYGIQVEHDYEHSAKLVTCAGFNACIATNTASWGSIAGSPETAISTIHKASIAASVHGSFGMIISDLQILQHHPAFCFSWPGILLGLGLAWNSSVHEDYLHARLSELLNLYVYHDASQVTGYLNVELGRLEAFMHQSIFQSPKDSALNSSSCKGSVLHQLLVDADSVLLDNFTFELIQQVIRHIKKFELELQKATPSCFQHGELILELRLAMDLLLFTCRLSKVMVSTGLNPTANSCGLAVINVGISNLPPISRTDLANRLLALIEQFRAVWLSRNLPCGLQVSLCMFNTLLSKLIPENDKSLFSVNGEVLLLQDMLTELTPGKEHPQDLELLQELQKTCYAMQSRIVDLIDRIGVEEITSDLLRINDELNNLFLRYDRYDKKRTAMTSNVEHKLPPPPSAENPIDKPLIDFGEAFEDGDTAAKLSNLNLQDSAASASNEQKSSSLADEFDMFAQARTSSFDSSKTKGSTYEDNTNPNQVEGSLASFAANKGRPMESGDLGSSNVPASNDFANFHNSRTTGLSAGATGASSQSNAVNNRRQMDKDDNDGALFAL